MMLLLSFFSFNLILSFILSYLALFMTKKKKENREKSSAFECGFDPKSNSRLPFSLRFFLITVIFLIFDVEIILLLPYLISSNMSSDVFSLITAILIILVLLGGTLYEWAQGSLKWVNS
ncbi:NADH dehydrogenase subunit 3 (mitochondrion) [Liolophura japonica]|uniref:NADH dehydrogenase subunit 3 n=1 Tax=Liolophura japonica TaxID=13599 RepID=UPI0023D86EB0|nr:NADH dehydrogenase subunit 3 [Liolophura japonica]WDQ44261.1 NADH dehydrogenase subunit 3 [Liolophura japonica]